MSRILVLFLFVLVSCGEASQETSIGQERSYDPQQVDDSRFKLICDSLESKAETLRNIAPTSYNYLFSFTERKCGEEVYTAEKFVRTKVVSSGSSYFYRMENGEDFYFPNVELSTDDLMKSICKNPTSVLMPVPTSNSGAMWFSFGMDPDECESDHNGTCIYFQRGSLTPGKTTYTIHTEEWIKFKMDEPNRGFIAERSMKSSKGCRDGEFYVKKAGLR
jgi:hypothetical protein